MLLVLGGREPVRIGVGEAYCVLTVLVVIVDVRAIVGA